MARITVVIAVSALIIAGGCTSSPEMTDSEWIEDLVANSSLSETSDMDGTGDPTEGKDPDVVLPEFWYRELLSEPYPEIILQNDPGSGVCTVLVVHELDAQLILDTVHDGFFDPGYKPIAVTRCVRLIAEKDENQEACGGWRITSVTPAEHKLQAQTQEVFVSSMSISKDDEVIWNCTDPETFYNVETALPQISEGDLITIEATVNHIAPQYDPAYFVVAHGPLSGHPRHLMFDNGLFGDRVADDGIFTYQFYAEYTCPHQRIAVDVIDADTFADQTEDDYDGSAWGIHFLR